MKIVSFRYDIIQTNTRDIERSSFSTMILCLGFQTNCKLYWCQLHMDETSKKKNFKNFRNKTISFN